MAEEEGLVFRTTADGWAEIITKRKDACADCGAAHCCRFFDSGSQMLSKALNRAGAGVGDRVMVSLKTVTMTKSAALIYMIPTTGIILGAVLGSLVGGRLAIRETAATVLMALMGLGLGFALTVLFSQRMSNRGELTPIITRIIQKKSRTSAAFPAIDPVCKMAVDPNKAPASVSYQGRTIYFCNPACREKFLQAPAEYLGEPS